MKVLNEVRDVAIKTIKKIKAVEEVVVYEYEAVWDAETSTFTIEELELPTPAADIIKVFKGKGDLQEVTDAMNPPPIICDLNSLEDMLTTTDTIYDRCVKWNIMLEDTEIGNKLRVMLRGYGSNMVLLLINLKLMVSTLQSQESRLDKVQADYDRAQQIIQTTNMENNVKPRSYFTMKIDSAIIAAASKEEKMLFTKTLNEWLLSKPATLLYRGSRDGINAGAFHSKCDNKGSTITIMKCGSGWVFGGFSDIPWWTSTADSYKTSSNAFLFTLKNPHNIAPTRIHVQNPEKAVRSYPGYGPMWGSSTDLYGCYGSAYHCGGPANYADTTGKSNLVYTGTASGTISEIEVFLIN